MEPKQTTPRPDYEWTDDARETVRSMWANGESMRKIAGTIGCSRGAIAGLISRCGWPKSPKPPKPSISKPTPRAAPKARPNMQTINYRAVRMKDEPAALPVERHIPRQYVALEGVRKTLQELQEHNCRWPCGQPDDPNFFFCGAVAPHQPYCEMHAKIAFVRH